jgi:cardiolipin synthase
MTVLLLLTFVREDNADMIISGEIVWLAFIILGRDAGLGIAAIYYRWISLPPPKTFTRYWDFSLPSAEVHPTTISKYNTLFQVGLIGMTTVAPIVAIDLAPALSVMQYVLPTSLRSYPPSHLCSLP